jgi:hypothetical protein
MRERTTRPLFPQICHTNQTWMTLKRLLRLAVRPDSGNRRARDKVMAEEKAIMTLEIAWSNPQPPAEEVGKLRRIKRDANGGLYVVSYTDGTEEFELTLGRAA